MTTRTIPCPQCGAKASGRFCSECGAVVLGAVCGSCQAPLTPGARFCHECGAPAGAARSAPAVPTARAAVDARAGSARRTSPAGAPPAARSNLPLILAGTAFVVVVIIIAAQRAGQEGPAATSGAAPMGGASAVDLSSMTPRERASRLFNRIMLLQSQGKADSARFFASMAVGVYESLGPLDADLRYDYGRVAEVAGNLDLARSQADSILQQAPDHLLGIILATSVAAARGETDRVAALDRQLLAAEAAELARGLQEYALHRADIDAALAAARSR
jgi:hypothetical protein